MEDSLLEDDFEDDLISLDDYDEEDALQEALDEA